MSDPGFEPRISGSTVCSLNYTKQYPPWASYGASPHWITQDQTLFPEGKRARQFSTAKCYCTPPPNLHLQGSCLCSSLVCFLCSQQLRLHGAIPYTTAWRTSNKMKKRQKHGLEYETQSSNCHMMQHEASSDGG